jgi:hypothetical protein
MNLFHLRRLSYWVWLVALYLMRLGFNDGNRVKLRGKLKNALLQGFDVSLIRSILLTLHGSYLCHDLCS